MESLAVVLWSYLLGSIPFGYIVVRLKSRVDIRETGSGKAGGFNTYVVTHSRLTGVVVGLLDAMKGLAAVYLTGLYTPGSFWLQSLALLVAVGGHIFPVWTRLKGGRGLATTAGGMLAIGFVYAAAWCTLWVIARLFRRDILGSNLAAILASPIVIWLIPWEWWNRIMIAPVDEWNFIFFSCVISLVLLISHLDAIKEVWKGSSKPGKGIPSSS